MDSVPAPDARLPLLVERPVASSGEAGLQLVLPDRAPVVLGDEHQPVRGFNPGWHAESLFTLLDPVWLLVLRHETDDVACWFVSSDGRLCAPPDTHSPARLRFYADRLRPIALWLSHAPGAPIRVPVPEPVRAWSLLPVAIRAILARLADPAMPEPEPAALARALEPAPGLVLLPTSGTLGYLIGNPGAMVPLMIGDTLAELHTGWRIDRIESGFSPLLVAIMSHPDGHRACWYVGLDGRLVGNSAALLPPKWRRHLLAELEPLFHESWRVAVLGEPAGRADGPPLPGADLPPAELAALSGLRGAGNDTAATRTWCLDAPPPPPGLAHVVPTATGLRGLDPDIVLRSLVHGLHGEMDRLLRTGRMVWPSPVTGEPVESDGFALLLDQHNFAYRFRDEATGLVFLVVCTGTHFYNHAVYLPAADLLVARNADMAAACGGAFGQAGDTLLRHALAHRDALQGGALRPVDPVVQQFFGACAIHIGHYVWQDLAGLAFLLRAAAGHHRLPHLHLFSTSAIQAFFGPEEAIFPAVSGRISRHAHGFGQHVEQFYRSNQRVIRYTAISVPAELGPAVIAAGNADPELAEACAAADAARKGGRPVVLFGIRVGNRTLDDLAEFGDALLAHLGRHHPGCTVVLDGLNDQHDRGDAMRDALDPDSDLALELALADRFVAAGAASGVRVVSGINRSALHSVVWCSRAHCFVAPLGAALSKYRWICNTPGLMLSSRYNLEHRADLRIYDAPAALEGSSEMQMNAPDEVHDVHTDRVTVGSDGRGNFVVDRAAVLARLDRLLERHGPAGG